MLGWTEAVKYSIDVGEAAAFKILYRRFMHPKKEALETELKKLLDSGVIRSSDSPWSSPVHLVKKKDGSIRFCIDYKKLNMVTRKNCGNKWFCILDLQSGYHQVAIHPDDIVKTAFSTHLGLCEWNVMPFGLCNAPATLEKMMTDMLAGQQWKICLVYRMTSLSFVGHWRNVNLDSNKCSIVCVCMD